MREDNHPAIVDRETLLNVYHALTGRDLQGEWLDGAPQRRLRDSGAQTVLKYLLKDPQGLLYVTRPQHPEYVRQTLHKDGAGIHRDITFALRAHLIDDIFLDRVKALAKGDVHLARHIRDSVEALTLQHTKSVISIDEHLKHVRLEQE